MSETTTPADRAGLQALARENGWQVRDSQYSAERWIAERDGEELSVWHLPDGTVAPGTTLTRDLPMAADVRAALERED